MTAVRQAIAQGLKATTTFVFPSEIVAEFWRRQALNIGTSRAVPTNRFISWDTFKEQNFNLNRTELPVNGAVRTVYALDFLNRVVQNELDLAYIIPPAFLETAEGFVRTIRGYLPRLNMVDEIERTYGDVIEADLLADIQKLRLDYEAFLQKRGMFEPGWETVDQMSLRGEVSVVYPEVIEDYAAFELILRDQVNEIRSTDQHKPGAYFEFDNSVSEASWIVRKILTLLQNGVAPSDVSITVTDTQDFIDILLSEAATEGLPVSLNQGAPLSDYPISRMWRAVQECAESGMSLPAMKALLLDGAIPWQKPEKAAALFRFGVENRCYRNYAGDIIGKKGLRLWANSLKRRGSDLLPFYTALENAVAGMTQSPTFEELRRQVGRFTATLLTIDAADNKGIRVYQKSADLLADLAVMEQTVGVLPGVSPYNTWMQVMADQIYVASEKSVGIPIYPYRVSAGIAPQWHFIAGVSQTQTDVPIDMFPYLREDHVSAMGTVEKSLTDEFLTVYATSGENTVFTYSKLTPSGAQLPPGSLLAQNVKGSVIGVEELGRSLRDDERSYWSGMGPAPGFLSSLFTDGFNSMAATGLIDGATELDRMQYPIPPGSIRDDVTNAVIREGELTISPTALDRFMGCPFTYLLQTACGVAEMDFDVQTEDPRMSGSLEHLVLAKIYRDLLSSGEPVVPGLLVDRAADVRKAISAVMNSAFNHGEGFLPPAWRDFERKLNDRVARFLGDDAAEHPDVSVTNIEVDLSGAAPDGTLIHGRLDRICSDGDEVQVLDFKKRVWMGKASMKPSEGNLRSYQIPFYIMLLEQAGMVISEASYYDVERGGFSHVFSSNDESGWWTQDELEDAKRLTAARIESMRQRISGGDYTVSEDGDQCNPCPLRGVCRQNFRVR